MHLGMWAAITDAIDPQELLRSFGTIGLFFIIFAESGLLVGFFLPGDSLLFTAGLFAARGDLNIVVVLVGCFLAAVIGDQVGYAFGKRAGPSIFRRPSSRIFKQQYIEQADEFFDKHGAKTILLARFVPIVRTFAPILAGVGKMPYRTFLTFNVMGGFLWAVGVTSLGYFLGDAIGADNIDKYLLPIIAVIIVVSVLPAVIEIMRHRRKAARAAAGQITKAESEKMAEHLHEEMER
ncbi:MAG TPA: DedA family protein [Acidimicrobiia bacterium]|nr:DedA family protein [Acidimicrobiia bacterium]